MMQRMSAAARHVLSIAAVTALLAPVAAAGAQPPSAAAAASPPAPSSCPTVANVDLRRIAREQARAPAAAPAAAALEDVVIPPGAARRPPPDATFVARVRLPPGGGYARDERAIVWREADGSWWGWRQVLNDQLASPPPPPMPGTPEAEQHARDYAAGRGWLYDPFPPYEGRLDPAQSARLEAAFADPCRRLEPDLWPWEIPLLRRENGSRRQRCQIYQDFTAYTAEFTERGLPPRRIGMRCGSAGTLNAVLITHIAHVELPRTESRRLTQEEVEAIRRGGRR